jgi:hypothetical protein
LAKRSEQHATAPLPLLRAKIRRCPREAAAVSLPAEMKLRGDLTICSAPTAGATFTPTHAARSRLVSDFERRPPDLTQHWERWRGGGAGEQEVAAGGAQS